jgi:predicted nucleic acid-binding protein
LGRAHGLDDEGIRQHVLDLQAAALVVDPPANATGFTVPNDPDDNPVVAAAIEGQAAVICTLDRHLQNPDVRKFCALHGIRILTDVELVQELRAGDPPQSS